MRWFRHHAAQLDEIGRGAQRVPAAVRLIASLALLKAALFLIGGLVFGRFIDHEGVAWAMRVAGWLHVEPQCQPLVRALDGLADVGKSRLQLLDLACFAYAALYLIQGAGLWFDRWWAEWLTVIMTCLLIPVECVELAKEPRWSVAVVLAVNLAVAVYLIRRLRQRKAEQRAMVGAPAAPVQPR